MILEGAWMVFWGGALGWALVELAKFGLTAVKGTIEGKYSKTPFWIGAVALAFVSGFVAVLNGVDHVQLVKAVQYGINAPAIISGLATAHAVRRARSPGAALGIAPKSPGNAQAERQLPFVEGLFLLQAW